MTRLICGGCPSQPHGSVVGGTKTNLASIPASDGMIAPAASLRGWRGCGDATSQPAGRKRTNPACVPWSPAMIAPASLTLPCRDGGWGGAMGHPWGRNVSGGSWVPWSLVQIAPRDCGIAVILLGNVVVDESR